MTDFRINVVVDPSRAIAGNRVVRRELKTTNNTADKLRGTLLKTFAILGAGAGIVSSVRLLADFSQSMSTVEAITGATATQMAALTEEAKRLGSSTRFSASEAAEGMIFLARAGFTAEESLQAVEGTLQLALSGALDLATAADIASNVLTSFRLEVEETARVVDVLALAANSSNTNVMQLGNGLKLVAPIAAGVNVSLEETTAAIGALSDAGLQGTLAGTGLRRVISELESPASKTVSILRDLGLTTDDVKISQVGLVSALEKLADAGLDTGTALELFGDRGGPAFEVLSNAIPRVKELTESLQNAEGTANRVANTMDDNLNGALLSVKSAFQGLVLEIGEGGSLEVLETSANGLASALRFLSEEMETVNNAAILLSAGFIAIKLGPVVATAGAATAAFVKLNVAVASGTAIRLGSARAAQMQALAEVESALATQANTAATLANLEAEAARAIVVRGSAQNDVIHAAVQAQVTAAKTANTAATTVLTAAQVKLGTATAATTVKARLLNATFAVNPFFILVAGATAAFLAIRKLDESLRDLEKAYAIAEAGAKGGMTAFGKVGQQMIEINTEIGRVEKLIAQDIAAKGIAAPSAVARLEKLKEQYDALSGKQDNLRKSTDKAVAAADKQRQAVIAVNTSFAESIAALENEARLLGLNNKEREVQNELLKLENVLRKEGAGATPEQLAELETLVRRNQALRDQAAALDEINGPAEDAARKQEALNALFDQGRISADQLREALKGMSEELGGVGGDGPKLPKLPEIPGIGGAPTGAGSPFRTEEISEYQKILNDITGAQELFGQRQTALNQLLSEGTITQRDYNVALAQAGQEALRSGTSIEDGLGRGLSTIWEQMNDVATLSETALVNAFNGAQDAISDFVTTGEADLNGLVTSILADLTKLLTNQLFTSLIGSAGGGAFGGFLSNLVGRANGTEFTPGNTPIIVGEKGPEIFNPKTSGSIMTNEATMSALGGGQQRQAPVVVPAPQVNLTNVNVTDPNEVADVMSGPEGEKIVLNHMRKNPNTTRRF